MKSIATITIILSLSGFTNPDRVEFTGDYNLFRIDRSRDADIVMYDVDLDNRGSLNTSAPIKVYWKKLSNGGELEPITGIQKNFGYGIRLLSKSPEMADFQLVSYKDQVFQIRRSEEGLFRVYTRSAGCEIEVKSLYIQFDDNAFWFPEISRIEIQGIDTGKGSPVTATITTDSGTLDSRNSVLKTTKK